MEHTEDVASCILVIQQEVKIKSESHFSPTFQKFPSAPTGFQRIAHAVHSPVMVHKPRRGGFLETLCTKIQWKGVVKTSST
jgi:hypothetical protein